MNLANRPPLGMKAEKAKPNPKHIQRVKMLPCVICGTPGPSDAHHCICGRFSQTRAPDTETIPLCKYHHQTGPIGQAIHAGKESWMGNYGNDTDYLPRVQEMLGALDDWF